MTDLASPVVQVVTSGTDWPAIAAAISGGVVGLAGIVFGARRSDRSISAEDERAKVAEKRRIYARCIAALAAYANDAEYAARKGRLLRPQRVRRSEQSGRSRLAALTASYEADLIASPEVALLVHRMTRAVLRAEKAGTSSEQASEIANAFLNATLAMRRDLGEHAPPPEEMQGVIGLLSHRPAPQSGG